MPRGLDRQPKIDKFQNVGVTNEYVEKQFYSECQTNATETFLSSTPNKFWIDMLAQVIGFMENTTGATRSPVLLSSNFIYNGKFMEQFLAFSMMDLPSNKLTPQTNNASNTLTITADTP